MAVGTPADFQLALAVALKMLRARDHFVAEVRARCVLKGCSDESSQQAIEELLRRNLLNDERLATKLAELWSEEKLWAPDRLVAELEKRGASADSIANATSGLVESFDHALKLASVQKTQVEQKIARRLVVAGYSEETVQRVLSVQD